MPPSTSVIFPFLKASLFVFRKETIILVCFECTDNSTLQRCLYACGEVDMISLLLALSSYYLLRGCRRVIYIGLMVRHAKYDICFSIPLLTVL